MTKLTFLHSCVNMVTIALMGGTCQLIWQYAESLGCPGKTLRQLSTTSGPVASHEINIVAFCACLLALCDVSQYTLLRAETLFGCSASEGVQQCGMLVSVHADVGPGKKKGRAPKAPKPYTPGFRTANYTFLVMLLKVTAFYMAGCS